MAAASQGEPFDVPAVLQLQPPDSSAAAVEVPESWAA